MKFLTYALLLALVAGCAYPERTDAQNAPALSPAAALIPAIILAAKKHDTASRSLVVDLASFAKVMRAFGDDPDPELVKHAVGPDAAPKSDDFKLHCPPRTTCRYPGNPLAVRVDSVEIVGSETAAVTMTILYNLRTKNPVGVAGQIRVVFSRDKNKWHEVSRTEISPF